MQLTSARGLDPPQTFLLVAAGSPQHVGRHGEAGHDVGSSLLRGPRERRPHVVDLPVDETEVRHAPESRVPVWLVVEPFDPCKIPIAMTYADDPGPTALHEPLPRIDPHRPAP